MDAIAEAKIVTKTLNDVYELTFPYLRMNDVMKIIKDEQPEVVSQSFDNDCKVQLSIRKSSLNAILHKFEKVEELSVKYLETK